MNKSNEKNFNISYQDVFYNSNLIMLLIDTKNGDIIDANPSALNFYGYSKDEMYGLKIFDINNSNDEEIWNKMNLVIKHKENKFYFKHKLSNGELRDVEVNWGVTSWNNKNVLHTVVNDITESVKSIGNLEESKIKYEVLFNSSKDYVYLHLIDDNGFPGRFIEVNDIAKRNIGYTREEFLDMTPMDIFDSKGIMKNYSAIMETLLEGKTVTFESILITKSGSRIPVEINSKVFQLINQPIVLTAARDITRRKIMEKDREKLIEEKEYNKLRSEFFANISHELKTPLNMIFSTIQFIKVYLESGKGIIRLREGIKYLDKMLLNSYRLLRIVNNIIDITKIDGDFYTLDLVDHNIICLINNIVEEVSQSKQIKGRTLEMQCETKDISIAVDSYSFERIILNLISNSIKFTDKDGKIIIKVYEENDYICISVMDDGIGIDKDKLSCIFDPFRQVDRSLNRANEGSGMGLSISRALVELHGGEIEVESMINKGSTFTVKFPDRKNSLEDNSIIEEGNNRINRGNQVKIELSDIYY
ncbi:MAG: PAS domain S-box protein [Firmicutes bacterium]|nr:PAS domain S-box protein [Bacillota bacterium]